MKNRDGQIAIDLVKDKKTREVFEKYATPYDLNLQQRNSLAYYENKQYNPYSHQNLQKRFIDGEDQYYCIQEQDDEYFYNPNQQIKQNYERNIPPPTINSIKNDQNQSNTFNNQSHNILEDSRVLNQYEIMIQQINQEEMFNKQQNLNDQQEVQNNFTFKNFFDQSLENYKEEEIEEQKYDQFIIKDSLYMNSPKFSTHQKYNNVTNITAHFSALKPTPLSLQKIQTPVEVGIIQNHKETNDEASQSIGQNIDSPTSTRKGKINEDMFFSPNPNNMNEFNSKADKVSNKMYIQKSHEIDYNEIEKYRMQSPIQRGRSQSQTSVLIQYQQSRLGSNTNTAIIDNEHEIMEPNMLSPRKHKYYLYFKSLKHRLAQEKSSVAIEVDTSQLVQNVGLVNFNSPTPNKTFQGFTYPQQSEGFTVVNEEFYSKDIESLKKLNTANRLPYQISEDESSPKERKIINFSECVGKQQKQLIQYQLRQKLNFDEDYDESNIVVDDIETNDIMKIQDSIKLKKIPGQNIQEQGYKQSKQQIKEYLQINQSIPFKLKNVYNTPCDPKKDLDFKMISNNQQIDQNQTDFITKSDKLIQQIPLMSHNSQNISNLNQQSQENKIFFQNNLQQQQFQLQQTQNEMIQNNQVINNSNNINNQQFSIANIIQQNNNQNQNESNQQYLQTVSPLLKRHSINGQLSGKKKIPLSPTPSTNSIFFVNRQVLSIRQLVLDEDMIESAYQFRSENQNSFLIQGANYEQSSALKRKKQPSISQNIMNSPQIEIQNNRKQSIISNRQKYMLEFSQNLLEIGISLFNSSPLCGLSFLILFDYIKPESEDIVKFLMQNPSTPVSAQQANSLEQTYLLKKSKQAITEILTDLSLQENCEILYYYSTFFSFSNSSFCSALRYFVQDLQLQNDPEQIDILLSCFAKKFFQQNQQQSSLFESSDSVHMLAFATFMLDIDIHFHKEHDLPKLIQEFQMNIQGINGGKNFSQDFINNIIENLLDKKITHIVSNKLIEKQKQHYVAVFNLLLHEKAQIFVSVFKQSAKTPHQKLQNIGGLNQPPEQELVLFILDNLAIVTNKNHTSNPLSHISIFSMLSLIISYKNQVLILKPAQIFNKSSIQVAKLDPQTQGFIVKQKQQLKFRVKGEEEGKLLDQKLRQLFSTNNSQNQGIRKN
ncbi:Sec7 domain protein (macronuclear) [Tetrahymena thermophila SB210]|uniref:Sec7 domain protein n=1 Tax=Tetrahymena thermophila (strain SB210) TaxID=312017 RepID=I7MJ33_TETTS|nr:Sec7 domain protein [Tetrahymena thermophila SB210]EAR95766.2 Sec7 domain protein [Tetrahymena thermophila SB210]|eukprot:XP_001016011.2 Sec7 domain protein [Tetrahymena thermophila SB210]